MIEKERKEILPHSRIYEGNFPKRFRTDKIKRIVHEALSLTFNKFHLHGEPEHLEGNTYLIHASFDRERQLETIPQKGRLNRLKRMYHLKMQGISIEEQEARRNGRAVSA